MNDLILEYKKGKKALEVMRENAVEMDERRIINEMISDMDFAIEWMKTGRRPNFYGKGIETTNIYNRRLLIDMDLFPALEIEPDVELSNERKKTVMRILLCLTERQLNCYLLHYCHRMSMQQIANELGVKKSTVQEHIETARRKITEMVEGECI